MNGDQRISPRSDDSQLSSSANLQRVQEFLNEKGGRPLNHVELAGLVHLLQNSVEGSISVCLEIHTFTHLPTAR